MSIAVSIKIDASALVTELQATEKVLQDKAGMHGAIAESAGKLVKDHLTANYLPKDGPRGDFWADVIESTRSTSDGNAASVVLSELGVSLRYFGGEVTPGKSISSYTGEITKALAIPSDKVPVSGGRQIRPGRAGLLAFIQSARGGETVGFLVEGIAVARKRDGKRGKKGEPYTVPKPGGSLLYTLRTITRHKGDKGILPSDDKIEDAAVKAILDFVGRFE